MLPRVFIRNTGEAWSPDSKSNLAVCCLRLELKDGLRTGIPLWKCQYGVFMRPEINSASREVFLKSFEHVGCGNRCQDHAHDAADNTGSTRADDP